MSKTAFSCYLGQLKCKPMPMGLRNSSAAFQRFMDDLINDLPVAMVFLDDVIIASTSQQEHLQHLEILFEFLSNVGLRMHPSECTFAAFEIGLLGHAISKDGRIPATHILDQIRRTQTPKNPSECNSVHMLMSIFRDYVDKFAWIMRPIAKLEKCKPKDFTLELGSRQCSEDL